MRLERVLFGILLHLFPRSFRDRYADEMWELARTRLERSRREGRRTALRTWWKTMGDMSAAALAERTLARTPPRGAEGAVRMRAIWGALIGASRSLVRAPGFALVSVAIAAIGIATNVAVFTVVNAFLLRPRPWAEPERVVRIYQDSDEGEPTSVAFPAYRDMAEVGGVFDAVAATSEAVLTWETDEGTRPLAAEFSTSSLLRVLGLRPALGRWFESAHDQVGAGLYAVVSYRTWQSKMGGDPGVVGRSLRLNGHPVTVLGVGPPELTGSLDPLVTDVFLSISSVGVGGPYRVENLDRREDHWYQVRARLGQGTSLAQAQAVMTTLAERHAEAYPDIDRGRGITVMPDGAVRLHPEVDGSLLPAAGLLMIIVGLVLVLACSNLATLLLVRGMAREGEVAVRRAMGASRARVAGLFLAEAMLLAGAGGALGLFLARQALQLVPLLPLPLPQTGELALTMDRSVLLFALVMVLATGMLFGLFPALRSTGQDVADSLRRASCAASPWRGARLFRNGLIAAQVGASMVLLVASGLLLHSFVNQTRTAPGFRVTGTAFLQTDLSAGGATPEERGVLLEELRGRLSAIPGVTAVGVTTRLPAENRGGSTTTIVDDYTPPSGTGAVELLFAVADPGYFEATEITLVAGRLFTPDDRAGAARVALLSRAAAERFWPGRNPLGRLLRPQSSPDVTIEVVGVVDDVKVRSLGEEPTPFMYRPLAQAGLGSLTLVAHSEGDAEALARAMRGVLHDAAQALPVDRLGTLEEHLGGALAGPRTAALFMGMLAVAALLLASLGIYAVVAFAVRRRTAELGIRMALGATRGGLLRLAVGEIVGAVAAGIGTGLLVAFPLGRFIAGGLYRVGGLDPTAYGGGAALVLLVAAVASYLPARAAAMADPVKALRAER